MLLDDLDEPAPAAEAFALARALGPAGPLAEDALAREVEAWARADRPTEASSRARDYLERFPAGRRLRAVRRHGGLE